MITKKEAYEFFDKYHTKSLKESIKVFKKSYPEFQPCNEKNLYRRLQKLHKKVAELIWHKNKQCSENKKKELFEEQFTPNPVS